MVVNGRSQDKVDAAVAALASAAPGSRVRGPRGRCLDRRGSELLTERLPDVDILINNAGIFEPKGFFDIPDDDWTRFYEINVMSGVRLARAYMPGMLKREWGRIVFISSESGLHIPKEMIHYGVTKTAQLAVARGLAEMTRGTAVTVNSVLPGPTMSEGVETFVGDLAKQNGQSVEEAAASFVKQHRPTLAAAAFCHRRGDRQHGGLCLPSQASAPPPTARGRCAAEGGSSILIFVADVVVPTSSYGRTKMSRILEQLDARPEALCAGRTAPHGGTGQAQYQ